MFFCIYLIGKEENKNRKKGKAIHLRKQKKIGKVRIRSICRLSYNKYTWRTKKKAFLLNCIVPRIFSTNSCVFGTE